MMPLWYHHPDSTIEVCSLNPVVRTWQWCSLEPHRLWIGRSGSAERRNEGIIGNLGDKGMDSHYKNDRLILNILVQERANNGPQFKSTLPPISADMVLFEHNHGFWVFCMAAFDLEWQN
jgi:hypothetical protein